MKVFYFHGFGMDKTNGGMFNDISYYLGESYSAELTSLNYELPDSNKTIVAPLSEQIETVLKRIQIESEKYIVIAHSQGCIASAYALNRSSLDVSQIILLAPPSGGTSERFISYLETLPGSKINRQGESLVALPTGRQGVIASKVFDDMDKYYKNVKDIYQQIPYKLNIIRTDPDEVLGTANNFSDVKLPIETIPNAKHAFSTGNSRRELLETIKSYIMT